jgi:hypothetical protein
LQRAVPHRATEKLGAGLGWNELDATLAELPIDRLRVK